MKAKITKVWSSENKMEMKTPNLQLECFMIFEGEDGTKYYLLESTEYILKLEGRRSPIDSEFIYDAHTGYTCEIEFEEFSGDKIITKIH